MKRFPQAMAAAALCTLAGLACSVDEQTDSETLRGALMFGLDDQDVVQLHESYLPEADLQLTIDRLTAPFDCALYGDLCSQIGEDRAIELTEELVYMGLDGASLEEIDARVELRTDEGMDALVDEEIAEDLTFRSSTGWYSRTSGNVRMLTRNGITTPVIGSRQAWTEAKTQRKNTLGIWNNKEATEICVNAGTNTQSSRVCGGGIPCSTSTFESINPSNTCVASEKSHKVKTYHSRNNGSEPGGGFSISYTLTARGCANAEIQGTNLSTGCAPNHVRIY